MTNKSTIVDNKKKCAIFLNDLHNKISNVSNEIENIKIKEEAVKKRIISMKNEADKSNKTMKRYENASEYALKSIELVYKNFDELQKHYKNIKGIVIKLNEKSKDQVKKNDLKKELIDEISITNHFEEIIKIDNKRNYLIIDSFINNNSINNYQVEYEVAVDNLSLDKLTLDNLKDNMVLKITEQRVELPYTKKEIESYMREYPEEYKTVKDVIMKEFVLNIALFNKYPVLARFKEAYYLCRTKEMLSIIESFNYAKELMFKSNINPYIIAAVKSKKQLEEYIKCLENNKLEDYSYFKIIYEVNPLAV